MLLVFVVMATSRTRVTRLHPTAGAMSCVPVFSTRFPGHLDEHGLVPGVVHVSRQPPLAVGIHQLDGLIDCVHMHVIRIGRVFAFAGYSES